jgi:hypothetical protein
MILYIHGNLRNATTFLKDHDFKITEPSQI